jgi:hypothetical protein
MSRNEQILNHYANGYQRSRQLEAAIKRFVHAVRDNPQFLEAANKFIKAAEAEIMWLESELNEYAAIYSELVKDERFLLHVMQLYGIDLNNVGTINIENLKEQIKAVKQSRKVKVPERLRPILGKRYAQTHDDYEWL